MATGPGIGFETLLRYLEAEERRWEEFFRRNPAALDIALDKDDAPTVREFLRHVFGVSQRTAERLLGQAMTPEQSLDISSPESLFAVAGDARAKLARFIRQTGDADFSQPRRFQSATLGEFSATPRKLVTHALVHSIRHWAQVATALRQHGYKQDWGHDFLFSDVLP